MSPASKKAEYGTWAAWRERCVSGGYLYLAIDSGNVGFDDDSGWAGVHEDTGIKEYARDFIISPEKTNRIINGLDGGQP